MASRFGKRTQQKKFKEKRKGRRGNYTFLLALSAIVIFIVLYFLMPAPVVPSRTPTPTPGPTKTLPPPQPIGPNPTRTPIAVEPLKTLQLQALCSPRRYASAWQVINPNAYHVTFTYVAQSLGTSASATLTVPGMSGTVPGLLRFESFLERGPLLMRIYVAADLQAMALANPELCPTTPTPTRNPSYVFPEWAYLRRGEIDSSADIPPAEVQIQAPFFKPDILLDPTVDTPRSLGISSTAADVPTGPLTDNYIFKGYVEAKAMGLDFRYPEFAYHYINDTDKYKNGYDFKEMVENFGKRGIFFVDGDIDTSYLWPDGVTLIATGTIHVKVSGNTNVGSAGTYAYGMSFLAGGSSSRTSSSNPSTACPGEGPSAAWVAHFEGQQNAWAGIAYVPNGLFWIDTDYQSSDYPAGPIIALSRVTVDPTADSVLLVLLLFHSACFTTLSVTTQVSITLSKFMPEQEPLD